MELDLGKQPIKQIDAAKPPRKVTVEVVIPVYNEEKTLTHSIKKLHEHMLANFAKFDWNILIADNGSSDKTLEVANSLNQDMNSIKVLHLDKKGRGRALLKAWIQSKADVMCYMDVDLSTNLQSLLPLVNAIANQEADISIGSRLIKGSKVVNRTLKREVLSRGYILIIKLMFFVKFSDAQCGFKAISRKTAQVLLPQIKDKGWFFDSEMLIIGEKNGFKIKEIPVNWVDDPDSRVNVIKTASGDLKGLFRLWFGGLRQVSRILKQKH